MCVTRGSGACFKSTTSSGPNSSNWPPFFLIHTERMGIRPRASLREGPAEELVLNLLLWTFPGSQDAELEKGRPVATPEMHWRGQRDVALLYLPQGQCRWVLEVVPAASDSSSQLSGYPRAQLTVLHVYGECKTMFYNAVWVKVFEKGGPSCRLGQKQSSPFLSFIHSFNNVYRIPLYGSHCL